MYTPHYIRMNEQSFCVLQTMNYSHSEQQTTNKLGNAIASVNVHTKTISSHIAICPPTLLHPISIYIRKQQANYDVVSILIKIWKWD